nr:hypothetical protein [Candidatus Minimicrobia vallesae]
MDEPAKGFDPVNRRLLMNIIGGAAKSWRDKLFTLRTRWRKLKDCAIAWILMKDGQAAAYGTLEEVKSQFGGASMDDIFVQVYGGEAKELSDE